MSLHVISRNERDPRPLAPRDDLPEHGELRAPARPGVGRGADRAGRLARRAGELGALDGGDRAGAGGVRDARAASTPSAWRSARPSPGLIAQVAAAIPDGSRVLAPEPEFVSLLFPFLAQAERGVTVESCRWTARGGDRRLHRRRRRLGRAVLDRRARRLDDIAAAASHHGALTVVDATHAIGWLPLDASRFDARRLRRLQVADVPARHGVPGRSSEALAARMTPHQAGWFAGGEPADRPVRPAAAARRTPRAASTPRPRGSRWVGTEPALQLINEIGVETIHAHDLKLANRFRAGLGLRARRLRDRHLRRRRTRRRSSRGRGSWPPPAPAACARPSTSTTPRRTWTRRWRRSPLMPGTLTMMKSL